MELNKNNTGMGEDQVPLKETEAKLEAIAGKNGSNANKLRDTVKDNQIT